jgi:hypothetical protein
MHSTKVIRALSKAKVGGYPRTSAAILNHIPASAVSALTSTQLAELLDGMAALAKASKATAEAEVLQEGAIYDPNQMALVEIK